MGVRAEGKERSGALPSSDLKDDILVKGLLHRGMLLFHIPASWPSWLVALTMLVPSGLAALLWLQFSGRPEIAVAALAVLLVFNLADSLLLIALPALELSFGPWKAQLYVLALPRFLVTFLMAFVPLFAGPITGLLTMVAAQTLGLIALVWAAIVEPFRLGMNQLEVNVDGFPDGQRPLRLLHISDLHVERLTRRERKLLELADKARPDLILITGDYLNLSYNRDPEAKKQVHWLLEKLSARHPVYAVLGSPPVDLRVEVMPLFDDLAIRLLIDEHELVDFGDGRRLALLGLDCTHHIPTDSARLDQLASRMPDSIPSVLLYHAPDLMPQAADHGIDLYLCGHTHGGQIRLPWLGAILTSSQYGKRYEMGLYRQGRTHMYVSRGVGMEGLSAPRVRFLAPPELTLITLRGRPDDDDQLPD